MKIRFKYEEQMEYMMTTYSDWKVVGEGVWTVSEDELAEEILADIDNTDFDSIKDGIRNYLWTTLDKDPDYIKFNQEDLQRLIEYIKEYEN